MTVSFTTPPLDPGLTEEQRREIDTSDAAMQRAIDDCFEIIDRIDNRFHSTCDHPSACFFARKQQAGRHLAPAAAGDCQLQHGSRLVPSFFSRRR